MAKYRIIKINDVCPWQIQKRVFLIFWENVSLSYKDAESAGEHLTELLKIDKKFNQ